MIAITTSSSIKVKPRRRSQATNDAIVASFAGSAAILRQSFDESVVGAPLAGALIW